MRKGVAGRQARVLAAIASGACAIARNNRRRHVCKERERTLSSHLHPPQLRANSEKDFHRCGRPTEQRRKRKRPSVRRALRLGRTRKSKQTPSRWPRPPPNAAPRASSAGTRPSCAKRHELPRMHEPRWKSRHGALPTAKKNTAEESAHGSTVTLVLLSNTAGSAHRSGEHSRRLDDNGAQLAA
eukprot:5577875-Pleurochrysis_carterae.AAC.2